MRDITGSYQDIRSSEELFSWWRQELFVREELRNMPLPVERLRNQEDCELLYRAWYFSGRRCDFFDLLFDSLGNWPVFQWLNNRPLKQVNEFLDFLAWKLCAETIQPEKLQFLINLFGRDHLESLPKVLRVLNLEQCRYLAARSGNSYLRDLLKQQESALLQQNPFNETRLGKWKKKFPVLPGIHGDKIQLLQDAASKITIAMYGHFSDPVGRERFDAWLEACDLLFRAGLIDDAFLTLKNLYGYYQEKNRIASVFADGQIHKNFTRLTRSMLPILALQRHPRQALNTSIYMYDRYFNRLNRDPGSLYYLALLESVREGLAGHNKEILWEVLYKCEVIRRYRSWDRGLIEELDITSPVDSSRIQEMLDIAAERTASRPHETLAILELLRLMHARELFNNHQLQADRLFDIYNDLWQWLPSIIFINRGILEHLAPLLDNNRRQRAQKLINVVHYTRDQVGQELAARSYLFRQKDAQAQREVLLGHILGVL